MTRDTEAQTERDGGRGGGHGRPPYTVYTPAETERDGGREGGSTEDLRTLCIHLSLIHISEPTRR